MLAKYDLFKCLINTSSSFPKFYKCVCNSVSVFFKSIVPISSTQRIASHGCQITAFLEPNF